LKFFAALPSESSSYHRLNADWHRDPLTGMLIWQAIANNLTLLSKDKNVAQYNRWAQTQIWQPQT